MKLWYRGGMDEGNEEATYLASVIPPPKLNPPSESNLFSVIRFAYLKSAGDLCWSLINSINLSDPTPAWSARVKHSDKSSIKPSSRAFPTSLEIERQRDLKLYRGSDLTSWVTHLKDIALSTLLPKSITFLAIAGTSA